MAEKSHIDRRLFLEAALVGAAAIWASPQLSPAAEKAIERRDLFPQGVASGDPDCTSVVLWTRRPHAGRATARLQVEVADNPAFARLIARSSVTISSAADWTCRALVGNLKPSQTYWYRFIDEEGHASRTGRTRTAPEPNDFRAVRFAFASCQNINYGSLHAYRRMIAEDERAADTDRLDFVLHLGDFIYEVVWYSDDRPQGMYGRPIRDILRYPHGERVNDYHIPTTIEDYREVYRAYLKSDDLQEARARWPFICIWDNHEFSQSGWQSIQTFNGRSHARQTRKVAANQTWFEYIPARVKTGRLGPHGEFVPPKVRDAEIHDFDAVGFGLERNNRAAVESLTAYRSVRWGGNIELIITDQRSYRCQALVERAEATEFCHPDFAELISENALRELDAGRNGGAPRIEALAARGDGTAANFRRNEPPQTLLGEAQRKWLVERLTTSTARWRIWANSMGTLEHRVDFQNLPDHLAHLWKVDGYAAVRRADYSTAFVERAAIYEAVKTHRVAGFVTLSGDRHSFWAGLAAASLPPASFEPVGIAFVTGSISSPSPLEMWEHGFSKENPLRRFFVGTLPGAPEPIANMLLRSGVRTVLEYEATRNLAQARRLHNPDLSPHLSFLDLGGNGYSTVRVTDKTFDCEFVCVARPTRSSASAAGEPLRYRIAHRARYWVAGERPVLEQQVTEGYPAFSL